MAQSGSQTRCLHSRPRPCARSCWLRSPARAGFAPVPIRPRSRRGPCSTSTRPSSPRSPSAIPTRADAPPSLTTKAAPRTGEAQGCGPASPAGSAETSAGCPETRRCRSAPCAASHAALSRSHAGEGGAVCARQSALPRPYRSRGNRDARRRRGNRVQGILHQPEPGRPHRRKCAAADQPRVRAEPGPVQQGSPGEHVPGMRLVGAAARVVPTFRCGSGAGHALLRPRYAGQAGTPFPRSPARRQGRSLPPPSA